jgi:hypothetical protein
MDEEQFKWYEQRVRRKLKDLCLKWWLDADVKGRKKVAEVLAENMPGEFRVDGKSSIRCNEELNPPSYKERGFIGYEVCIVKAGDTAHWRANRVLCVASGRSMDISEVMSLEVSNE